MILVTGSTGNVGSHLVPALRERGLPVKGLVHSPHKVERLRASGAEAVVGEFEDPGSLEDAFSGVNRVFMLTPTALKQPEWEQSIIAAARGAGASAVVKLSVVGADPDSELLMCRNHGRSESALRESGIPWTVLRCNEFMQNFLLSASTISAEGKVYGTGVGSTGVAMVDARDIASVAATVLADQSHEGSTHLLTGAEAVSFEQAARQLSAGLGTDVSYVELPAEGYRSALVDEGTPEWYADALAELYAAYGGGLADQVTPAVRDVTGSEPRSVEDFARDHAQALLGG
jgi:uncharacterized protein YbjT (DUF2867 family)